MKSKMILAALVAVASVPAASFANQAPSRSQLGEKRTVSSTPMHGVSCDADSKHLNQSSNTNGRYVVKNGKRVWVAR